MNHTGKIMVGQRDGVYLLKLLGDVRVTLCISAEGFFDRMFKDPDFQSVLVDLSAATGIDSTSLGILAKLSIGTQQRFGLVPTLVVTSSDLERVLRSSGFSDVFHLVTEPLERVEQLGELPPSQLGEDALRQRVIDAHKTLMGLNERNQHAFQDLVAALEAEDEKGDPTAAAAG